MIKEAAGGTVTVLGVDLIEELDGVLHTALAKGADKAAKIVGDLEPGLDSHTHARLLAGAIKGLSPDIVLTGVQAADDLDGQIGPMLAAHLDAPYVGVVTGVEAADGKAMLYKEYAGGVMAKFEVDLADGRWRAGRHPAAALRPDQQGAPDVADRDDRQDRSRRDRSRQRDDDTQDGQACGGGPRRDDRGRRQSRGEKLVDILSDADWFEWMNG